MSVSVKLIFFAKAREIVGKHETLINLPTEILYEDLFEKLVKEYNLKAIEKNFIIALNQEYCSLGTILALKENDEIAVIPPLSGG